MIEMAIDSIRVSITTYQRVVILRAKEGNRFLPIWIGPSEADAIAVRLQDVSVPRPLTHDLLRSVISSLGASVSRIVVSELTDDTFYAKIVVEYNGSTLEVDSRPSDALALAVRADAPIFAEDAVLEKAGVRLDEETGEPQMAGDRGHDRPLDEEELKRLSAFTDFVNTLDLEGLGKEEKPPAAGSES